MDKLIKKVSKDLNKAKKDTKVLAKADKKQDKFIDNTKKHLKNDIHESTESIKEDKKLVTKSKMKGK